MNFLSRNNLFAAIVGVTFLCFAPSLANSLLDWDDAGYIIENTNIHSFSLETIRWAFGSIHLNYWAPLTWLSLAVDYAFWGVNPVGYHLTNNLLHALNAGLFFLISLRLIEAYDGSVADSGRTLIPANQALYCAALSAGFFAIHPLRVESVAWATERKDVLALFFGLISILFYLKHANGKDSSGMGVSRFYWWSLVFFIFSLCSKSMLVTLPVVLLVLDWFPLHRLRKTRIAAVLLEKVPYLILSGAAGLFTIRATELVIEPIDRYTRFLNAMKSIVSYLRLTVWPFDLNPFYVHPFAIKSLTTDYLISIAFCVLLTIASLLTMKRWPILLTVWLIFLIALLPFLGITQQIGAQSMAGRFTYFSGLPLSMLFAVGVMNLYARSVASRPVMILIGAGVVVVLLMGEFLTVREISFWRDDVTLWTRVIELSPNTGKAYFQRGHAYALKRDYPRSLSDLDQAISIAAGKRYRAMHEIYLKRAFVLSEMGNFAGAVDDYTRALETATGEARQMTLYQRGLAYRKLGDGYHADEDLRMSGMLVTPR